MSANPPFCRFDFHDPSGRPQTLVFSDPVEVITAGKSDEVLPALRRVDQAVQLGHHAAGFVAFDAAPGLDSALRATVNGKTPLLWFGIFDPPVDLRDEPPQDGNFKISKWQYATSRDRYDSGIAAIRSAIARGDTYLVNYTTRLKAQFAGDSAAMYAQLRAAQAGAGYCAHLDIGRFQILSASPELFFRTDGGQIVTRPMKGTAQRGRWTEDDLAVAESLPLSEKNRAENVMTVDLLRNDLGKIAIPGTVEVPKLFEIEKYPTVFQMTSTVTANLRPEIRLPEIFAALFPSGSVTGAPKVSTMNIIADLEDSSRGVYCGAIGHIAPGGDAVFNVAIRTVVIDSETGDAEFGVGGAVTWDSTSEGEYAEMGAKAAVLAEPSPDFDLLETMKLEDGVYALLDRHIARLAASSAYFSRPCDLAPVERALNDFAAAHATGAHRVRLLVSRDGRVKLEGQPLVAPPEAPLPVVLADTPIDRNDRFLYHKTTHRAYYDTIRTRLLTNGAFDVLLKNDADELTEFTIGNMVMEIDNQLWTPPLECGLLPGTMRAELLERGEIRERVLVVGDLPRSSRLWLINGVRGWVPVTLA